MTEAALGRRVLMLDDDQFFLGVQAKLLQRLGCEVATSANAESALARLQDGQRGIDVVVCDLNMPGVDGIDFLERLAASSWQGDVVLQSGEGPRIIHAVRRLLARSPLRIVGSVEKPATAAEFRRLLQRSDAGDQAVVRAAPLVTAEEIEEATRAGQWLLHYQPKVDLRTGDLRGVEALVRWSHPRHGLLYPDRFISVAEASGGIDGLTEWVLREALRQVTVWMQQGILCPVAINLSMGNLERPDFVERLMAIIDATSVSPVDVTLEVTESRLMSRSLEPLKALARLRMQRFSLAIDDFGTGHSSLVQLRDVPFNELKIDRGFVTGARHNAIVRPILEGSIGMARGLGLQSVAEGVETEDDWALLQELGCDQAQGWFISVPMAGGQLPQWRRAWADRRRALAIAPGGDGESALLTLI